MAVSYASDMSSVLAPARRLVRWMARQANPDWEAMLVDYCSLLASRRPGKRRWMPVRRCPDARLDAGSAAIGHLLYVFGGFVSESHVLDVVDVLDLGSRRWVARWPLPSSMAQSHLGVATDGTRFIFLVSGQLGNHCRPATTSAFVLDTATQTWSVLPALPEARYAPAAQIWNGRLHVLGGSREDRHSPATDHWSLGVESGRATDASWRAEPAVPIGGPHRASAVIAGRLFVFGGQLGDYVAIPGDPDCRCTGEIVTEQYYADCFAIDPAADGWVRVAPMPIAVSHTESSVIVVDGVAYLFGGQCESSERRGELAVSDVIQRYDAAHDRWALAGTLPYRVKTPAVAKHDGWVYAVGGQRDRDAHDARPGEIVNLCWRTRFH